MRRITLAVLLLITSTTALEAYPIYGFQIGMNINQLRSLVNKEKTDQYSYGSNWNLGVVYRTDGRKFRQQIGFLYNPKGAKDLINAPQPFTERKFRLDYVTLSAPFLYNSNSEGMTNWTVSIGAGPYFSKLVHAVSIDRTTSVGAEKDRQKMTIGNDVGDGVKGGDAGVTFYFSYKLSRFNWSMNYDMGLTNISNTPNKIVRNRTFAINLGFFVQQQGRKQKETR